MGIILISFFAGILTALAPCVLPLLPVILWSSISTDKWYRPLVIVASLIVSISIFTLLIKVVTYALPISSDFWESFSGLILVIFWIFMIFPEIWDFISTKFGFKKSWWLMQKATWIKSELFADICLGAALGPVFNSCSPTYFLLIWTIIPASLFMWILSLLAYNLGLWMILLAIAYGWRGLLKKLNIFSDSRWYFKRVIWILILLTGIAVWSGYSKIIEAKFIENWYLDTTSIEEKYLNPSSYRK